MGEIKAGVTLMQKFITPDQKDAYSDYLDYKTRKEAIREDLGYSYDNYMSAYMDNSEKTTGLFDAHKDFIGKEEKKALKIDYQRAQDNGSVMWIPVFSFDNRWAEKMGIYDSSLDILNENAVRTAVRKSMDIMLGKEGIINSIWTAAIHRNTDNIHVHISCVEPFPTRKIAPDGQAKGRWSLKTLRSGKSAFANYFLQNQMEYKFIQSIKRERILANPYYKIIMDPDLEQKVMDIAERLPVDRRLWKYNMNAMNYIRKDIDQVTTDFLEKYFREDFVRLKAKLYVMQKKYEETYGTPQNGENRYMENQIADLYARVGNHILSGLRESDKKGDASIDQKDNVSLNPKTINEEEDRGDIDILNDQVAGSHREKEEGLPESDWDKGLFEDNPEIALLDNLKDNQQKKSIGWDYYKTAKSFLEIGEISKSVSYLEYSAKLGNELAMLKLGKIYKDGLYGIKPDIGKAFRLFSQAKGNGFAAYQAATMSEQGLGTDQDQEVAYDLYRGALEAFIGMVENPQISSSLKSFLSYRVGLMFEKGQGTSERRGEAVSYYKTASDLGNAYADYRLGKLFLEEGNDFFDPEKGILYLQKASGHDHPYAQALLGNMYIHGKYVKMDISKGQAYLKASYHNGNRYAKVMLDNLRNNRVHKKSRFTNHEVQQLLYSLKQGTQNYMEKALNMQIYLEDEWRREQDGAKNTQSAQHIPV